jgi:hypothetical protein
VIIDYIGDYQIDLQSGPVKNAGYRIYKKSWHKKHYNGSTIRANVRPRWKFISVHPTELRCREEIRRLIDSP